MGIGIEKCAMLIMRSRKRRMTEGIELPNRNIRTFEEKETYKLLENLEAGPIKHAEIK